MFENTALSQEKLNDITKYESSFGKEWVANAILWAKAEAYIKTNLVRIESTCKTPFTCCQEGKDVYRRLDNSPITQDDLYALANYTHGQGNKIIGKPGDMEAIQEWFCDSSD